MGELYALGLEQEDIEQVQVADTGAVAAMGIGPGTQGQGGAQQLGDADKVRRGNGQRAAQQYVIGMGVGVVQPGRVVVLQVSAWCQVERVIALVGGLGVIGLGRKRGQQ